MKILLVTFDKEMENKIKGLLKDYQIVVAKNGEEALLADISDVDLVIYDALAGGIAEEDINRLYEEAFRDKPFLILMDDLFPIDPANIKPKNKKIISRETDIDKIPELIKQLLSGAVSETEEKKEKVEVEAKESPSPQPTATQETTAGTDDWESLFGMNVELPKKEKEEEKAKEETPTPTPETEPTPQPSPKEEVTQTTTAPAPAAPKIEDLKKQCLVVSFDIPLVEKIEQLIGDKCELYIARSAKQALQKYGDQDFDIIIFDTISGVFAEKGIRDLYEKGGYKDSLYVLLLDEFMPLDVDRLPVKNLRTVKRESELELLPEIVESAPHITLQKAIESAAATVEAPPQQPTAEKPAEEITPVEKTEEERETKEEEKAPVTAEKPSPVETSATPTEVAPPPQPATPTPTEVAPPTSAPTTVPAGTPPQQLIVSLPEEKIEQLVEKTIMTKVVPLIEEIIKNKLSDELIKAMVGEIVNSKVDRDMIRGIIEEIAEPLVREVLEELLS